MRIGRSVFSSSAVLCLLLAACSPSQRVQAPPRVTATGPVYTTQAVAPDAGNVVAVYFTLADAEDLPADVLFEVSRGVGGAFTALGSSASTGDVAVGGDGVKALTAPPAGRVHRLLWKPPADLAATEEVRFRLTPSEPDIAEPPHALAGVTGAAVTSAAFTLGGLVADPR